MVVLSHINPLIFKYINDVKRYLRLLFISVLTCLIVGCSSPPQVHLFSTHLSSQSQQNIVSSLTEAGFDVQLNTITIPHEVSTNTLTYNGLLRKTNHIETLIELLDEQGFSIANTHLLASGNHSFSANHIGLYLFPQGFEKKKESLYSGFVNEYSAKGCQHNTTLQLNEQHRFQIDVAQWQPDIADYQIHRTQGRWQQNSDNIITLHAKPWPVPMIFERSIAVHDNGQEISLVPLDSYFNEQMKRVSCHYTIDIIDES